MYFDFTAYSFNIQWDSKFNDSEDKFMEVDTMKRVIAYLLANLLLIIVMIQNRMSIIESLKFEYCQETRIAFFTIISAYIGGVFYCLRAVYETCCVRNNWDDRWIVWYFLRPVTSLLSGFLIWLALKSGTFMMSGKPIDINIWISCFLGFIAGMNVKNIQKFIEETFKKKAGVNPSNQSQNSNP